MHVRSSQPRCRCVSRRGTHGRAPPTAPYLGHPLLLSRQSPSPDYSHPRRHSIPHCSGLRSTCALLFRPISRHIAPLRIPMIHNANSYHIHAPGPRYVSFEGAIHRKSLFYSPPSTPQPLTHTNFKLQGGRLLYATVHPSLPILRFP